MPSLCEIVEKHSSDSLDYMRRKVREDLGPLAVETIGASKIDRCIMEWRHLDKVAATVHDVALSVPEHVRDEVNRMIDRLVEQWIKKCEIQFEEEVIISLK